LKAAEERIESLLGADHACSVSWSSLAHVEPCVFDPTVVSAVETAAQHRGLTYRRMISGAGHDAQIMQRITPSAMVFIPSQGSISHHPAEFSLAEHILSGAHVLADAVLSRANATS